jgi:hypothetical protein
MRNILVVVALSACAATTDEASLVDGPGAKADGLDRADRTCRVVLRTLAQPFGLPTHSFEGANWVVWEGRFDVQDSVEGTPYAMFTSRSTNGWWRVPAVAIDGAQHGHQRYSFRLDRHTVVAGESTAWRDFRIEVLPYVEAEDGARLFDHNRLPDDFANYVLDRDRTTWVDDQSVCQ